MPQIIIRFIDKGQPQWGVLFGQKIAPLQIDASTTRELLTEHWERLWSIDATKATIRREAVRLLPPITTNQQFLCQGVNYRSHIVESGLRVEDLPFNTLFTKAPSCITAADAPVARPPHVQLLDYELELGLVLRRDLPAHTKVSMDNLHDWLGAVTIVNDLTARDVQLPQGQFYKGKSYRGFGPVGPVLVLLTPDEWARWPELHMRLEVNGQPRQDAYCKEMLHAPDATLTELSSMHDVQAGDLIATGTPAGCALRAPGRAARFVANLLPDNVKWRMFIRKSLPSQAYLQPGDRITASIRTDDGAIDLGQQATSITTP